jgi:hypothetical protein
MLNRSNLQGSRIMPGSESGALGYNLGGLLHSSMQPLAVVFLLFLAQAPSALGRSIDLPQVKIGTIYSKARAELMAAGSRPIPFSRGSENYCDGAEDVCRAYPETESCAIDQNRPCIFHWRTKEGTHFVVGTVGEEFAKIAVSTVRVQLR